MAYIKAHFPRYLPLYSLTDVILIINNAFQAFPIIVLKSSMAYKNVLKARVPIEK
jgi:hypothetical protein